jgi:hypothetical protein
MGRAKRIRVARAIVSSEALALIVAVAALWGIGREVWVARVFQNAPRFAPSVAQLSAVAHFWLAAFANTRSVVQVLALAALAAVIYLAREAARTLSRPHLAFA